MYLNSDNSLEVDYNNLTLSEIVTKNFKAAAIFEKYELDFCCKGKKLINQACEEKGLNSAAVLNELKNLNNNGSSREINYNEWALDFLIDYIINTHHQYIRNMIPVLITHTQKVAAVHGDNHPETIEVAKHFSVVYKDLKQHMMKEEEILFPHIKYLFKAKRNGTKAESPYFGTVKNPIKMMELEHQAAGDELFEIRKLTSNYTPPADACNTFKVCYRELKDFEEDLHKHVHLENNILFPKSLLLEDEIKNIAL